MGIYSVKPAFQRHLRPVSDWLARHDVHPTWINVAALILSCATGFLLYTASMTYTSLLIPFFVFLRTALNALDGMVARANDVDHRAWGEVMNEFIDRVSDIAIFSGLAFNPFVNTVMGLLAVAFIVLTSFVGVLSKAAGGERRYEGVMGKADRMFAVGLLGAITPWTTIVWFGDLIIGLVFLGCAITIAHRLVLVRGALHG